MDTNKTKQRLNNIVNSLIKSERVTKKQLADFSRDYIPYVYETKDIGMVNRLLNGLTPMNKNVSCFYFPHFIGWVFDKETKQFKGKDKDKIYTAKKTKSEEFLKVEANNIWTWAEKNVSVEKKPTDYAKNLTNTLKRGIKETGDNGLNTGKIVKALMDADVNLKDLMKAVDLMA